MNLGLRLFVLVFIAWNSLALVQAETLTSANVQISWKVANRFRLFRDPDLFKKQEQAWREYGQHLNARSGTSEDAALLYYNGSVLGSEHTPIVQHMLTAQHRTIVIKQCRIFRCARAGI